MVEIAAYAGKEEFEYKQNCKADILRKKVDFARHQHDKKPIK